MPAKKLRIRPLKASEVTFEVTIEQDDIQVRGNAMASGDDALDKQVEDQILSELDAGNIEAWCCITVKATWEGITGVDYLGACSHLPGDDRPSLTEQVEQTIEAYGMRANALADLNTEVQRQAERGLALIDRLKVTRKR